MGADAAALITSVVRHTDWDELTLTVTPDDGLGTAEALLGAVSALHRAGADFIRGTVMAEIDSGDTPPTGPRGVPVTLVQGRPCRSGSLAGAHVVGARGNAKISTYSADENTIVTVVEDRHARWAYVGNVGPSFAGASSAVQARETFERSESALQLAGMSYRNVVRTWLWIDDILGWYEDLNRVRTRFFRERGVFDGLVPASTGIGACNPMGAALVLDLLAVEPHAAGVALTSIPSPLQCSAEDYGSSFSRALEIEEPGLRRLLVSGTASIAPSGETLHVGDVAAQIERTMDVVEALLLSRGMLWADVTRAIAYCRDADDAPKFDRYCASRRIELPVVTAECVICRDDLLFEIEVDAASAC